MICDSDLAYFFSVYSVRVIIIIIITVIIIAMQVILSHATHLYLDHPYEPDFDEPGLYWATSYIDTRKLFEYLVPTRRTLKSGGSSQLQRSICDQYWMDDCAPLGRLDNVVGWLASFHL